MQFDQLNAEKVEESNQEKQEVKVQEVLDKQFMQKVQEGLEEQLGEDEHLQQNEQLEQYEQSDTPPIGGTQQWKDFYKSIAAYAKGLRD